MEGTKPTVGIEREIINILGAEIVIWDLGGQEKYRAEYINDLRIFAATSSLIFVLDILTPERFELALQYYTTILILIESLGLTPQIIICLHKADPDLKDDSVIQGNIQKARELFKTNSRRFEVNFFNTSIYDIKSIIRAFTPTFQQLIKTLQPFRKILQSLVEQLKFDGAMLFNANLMLLSEFYSTKACEELCLNVVYCSLREMKTTQLPLSEKKFTENFESHINLKSKEQNFKVLEIRVKDWDLYLLLVGREDVDINQINPFFSSMD